MSDDPDLRRHLLGLINGLRISQALHVGAVLRALATAGLYVRGSDGRFACTALGDELRTGADGLGDWAVFSGAPSMWQAWGRSSGKAGLRVTRVEPTGTEISIIEARPAT